MGGGGRNSREVARSDWINRIMKENGITMMRTALSFKYFFRIFRWRSYACVSFTSGFQEFSSIEKNSLQEKNTASFSTGFRIKLRNKGLDGMNFVYVVLEFRLALC